RLVHQLKTIRLQPPRRRRNIGVNEIVALEKQGMAGRARSHPCGLDDAGKYGFQAEGEAITKSALGLPRCVAVLILVYRHSRPTASFRPFARTEIDGEDQGGETSCRARRRRDGAE